MAAVIENKSEERLDKNAQEEREQYVNVDNLRNNIMSVMAPTHIPSNQFQLPPLPAQDYSATVCRNLLESYPYSTSFIESSHKWTQILFIISNSKLGIWIYGQPPIDVNSQYIFL